MSGSWASPYCVAVWMALHALGRPATEAEIADSLGWLPHMLGPALGRLRYARVVQFGPARDGKRTWVTGNDLRKSLRAYGVS
jgi:hypothetical protein